MLNKPRVRPLRGERRSRPLPLAPLFALAILAVGIAYAQQNLPAPTAAPAKAPAASQPPAAGASSGTGTGRCWLRDGHRRPLQTHRRQRRPLQRRPRPRARPSVSNRPRKSGPISTSPSLSTSEPRASAAMQKPKSREFLFEVFALIVIAIIVQGFYATVVRPQAAAVAAVRRGADAEGPELRSRAQHLRDHQGLRAGSLFHPRVLVAGDHGLQGLVTAPRRGAARHGPVEAARRHEDPARGFTRLRAAGRGAAARDARANCCRAPC